MAIFEVILFVPTLYLLASYSAYAVAIGHVIVAFITSAVRLIIAIYILELSPTNTLRQFIPSITSMAVMSIAVLVVRMWVSDYPVLVTLISQVLVGAVVYGAVLWCFEVKRY